MVCRDWLGADAVVGKSGADLWEAAENEGEKRTDEDRVHSSVRPEVRP